MVHALTDQLSKLLVEAKMLTLDQIQEALHAQEGPEDSIDRILISRKLISKKTLLSLLMDHYKIPFMELPQKIDIQILKLLPESMVSAYQVLPVGFDGGEVTIAMVQPENQQAVDRLAATTGFRVRRVGMLESDYRDFYARYFEDTTMTQILKEIELHQQEASATQDKDSSKEEQTKPMGKLVDSILEQAAKKRASDIHIEPQENFALIRFRIDGVLQTFQSIPARVLAGLVSRLKVMCALDITEHRVPQDGNFRHHLSNREVDVRVSTVPSRYGEKVAMRILDRRSLLMNLDLLGMSAAMQERVEKLVTRPNGLFLVTGPTGSGKTTSLYAVIQMLRSPRLNIMTLEDPIEYELLAGSKREGGITQIQINPKVGLTFASGLRSLLRQDPDIIFVGEIRDRETAETAISAALTGHMVLSSLHTNGAIQTINRLLDMGVEPFLIASALRGVVSQRLVRTLCHHCKEAYTPPVEALQRLGLPAAQDTQFFKPVGCPSCQQQGYWGRTGVFELLALDNTLNRMILAKQTSGDLFQAATKAGFNTLKTHGMELVCQGITSVEEVLRVLPQL